MVEEKTAAKCERIVDYSSSTYQIRKIKIDPSRPQTLAPEALHRGRWSHGDMIWTKEALVVVEDYLAGSSPRYSFWYDEVHYILEGKAEMTYLLSGTRFSRETTVTVEAGDCYVIPSGAEITWKVDSAGPLRKLCVVMPGPELYSPEVMIGRE